MVESSLFGSFVHHHQHKYQNYFSTFHNFRRLPLEVQGLIWTLLLPSGPTVFEVSDFHETLNEYDITGEGAVILAICGAHNSVPGVRPIYLPRGRYRRMPKAIYIRPDIDTLYIPFPELLDTITMSQMSENQVLKRLGIVSSAFDCLQMGSHKVHETSALPLLMNLKNLKEMYIIDGFARGLEDWEVRPYTKLRDFTFELADVKVGTIGRNFLGTTFTADQHGFWEVWSSAHVDLIRKAFEDQKKIIEKSMDGGSWVIPDIVGKTIWRK